MGRKSKNSNVKGLGKREIKLPRVNTICAKQNY